MSTNRRARSMASLGLAAGAAACAIACAAACAPRRAERGPAAGALGDTLRVTSGASVSVDGGRLVLHVDSTSDSRCPRGAQCVWSGEVVVSLRLDAAGATTSATVHSVRAPTHATHAGYDVVVVGMTPYPTTEPADARVARVALLVVTRP